MNNGLLGNPLPIKAVIGEAWVVFNGNTGGINASYNVASITKNGTGDFTITFITPFLDQHFVWTANVVTPDIAVSPVVYGSVNDLSDRYTKRLQVFNPGSGAYTVTRVCFMAKGPQT